MPRVELYTRTECCLCDDAKAVIERVRASHPFELRVIDIDTDPRLVALYGWEIPVVVVDGRKHAKLRLDERRFAERIARAARGEGAPEEEPAAVPAPVPAPVIAPETSPKHSKEVSS